MNRRTLFKTLVGGLLGLVGVKVEAKPPTYGVSPLEGLRKHLLVLEEIDRQRHTTYLHSWDKMCKVSACVSYPTNPPHA